MGSLPDLPEARSLLRCAAGSAVQKKAHESTAGAAGGESEGCPRQVTRSMRGAPPGGGGCDEVEMVWFKQGQALTPAGVALTIQAAAVQAEEVQMALIEGDLPGPGHADRRAGRHASPSGTAGGSAEDLQGGMMTDATSTPAQPRKRGRKAIYGSDAERQAAYRARQEGPQAEAEMALAILRNLNVRTVSKLIDQLLAKVPDRDAAIGQLQQHLARHAARTS